MRKTIHKLFWAWEHEKEEQWLNRMSAEGWQLQRVGFYTYVFEEGPRGAYTYRLELLDYLPEHEQNVRYLQFMEETGAEHIGSYFRWVYFRKKTDGADFNLFSDLSSRIRHLDRILLLAGVLAGLNLFNAVNQLLSWHSRNALSSLVVGMLCLFVGLLIGYGFLRVLFKRRRLTREKILRE